MTARSVAPITATIVEQLRAGTGRPIGELKAPENPEPPYAFVTRTGRAWDGSWGDPHEIVTVTYQVTIVGLDDDGVEWLDQRVREVLAGAPTLPGWNVIDWFSEGDDPGIRPDDDATPPLMVSTPSWTVVAQPLEENP